ncbi:hypothetical protein [Streptomyces sp. NPDC005322]|uniref:hypothetical protein n=1 Tax=Streptomyces sp. NPDC005322 TaxID=3157032 RepID=UPI0033A6447A
MNDRTARASSAAVFICGAVIGIWWPMPIVLLLDDRRGSFREAMGHFDGKVASVIADSANSGDMVSQLVRVGLGFLVLAGYYMIAAVGPAVFAYRMGRGYQGIKFPGRKAILLFRRSAIVCACVSAVVALAKPLGKSGERRVVQLHEAAGKITQVRKLLSSLPRLEAGPRNGRRRRKRIVRRHVRRVEVVLGRLEDRAGEASDRDLKEIGEILLKISGRLADQQYRNLLDAEDLQGVAVPEREALRLALGAMLVLLLSGTSMGVLGLLGFSDGLEPVAIGTSVVVSAVIVFRGKALEKLESIGVLGAKSDRGQQ